MNVKTGRTSDALQDVFAEPTQQAAAEPDLDGGVI
jgi:hypothetical protein